MLPMDCLNEDTLLEFLQHQLPSQERAEVERHLDTCAECRRWLAEVAADGPVPPAAPEQSSPEDPTALAPGSSVGHFIVLEQVGAGAMGRVYAAHDPQLHRKVALKLLREEGTASLP
jgi:anti-sigma factor RsiW